MKRLVALIMCALSLGAAAQSTVTYPFNPDANSDGFIGVSDILEGVATYGNAFTPSEVLIDGAVLQDVISQLEDSIAALQLSQYGEMAIFNSGIGGGYSAGSPWEIPLNISAVVGLAGTSLSGNGVQELRLPHEGVDEGKKIDVVARGKDGNNWVKFKVMVWQNDSWNELDFIQHGFYGGNCGLWCESRRFVFINGAWTSESSINQVGW